MYAQRNVANILIANSVGATAGMETLNIDEFISSLSTGEPVVLSPSGIVVDATGTLPSEFKIATKLSNGDLNYSDIIKAKSIKSIHTNRYVAPTNQLDYIGYNGTSGAIEVINNNIYSVKLNLIPTDVAGFMQQKIKEGFYETDSTATQREIAYGLTSSLIKNFSREPDKVKWGTDRFTFNRINSGSVLNALGTATLSVTKGSTAIVFSEDMTGLVTAGTILRIGGLGAGTTPCYVVESHNGGAAAARVYFLDIPWQGTSNTAVAANLVESVTEGNWGIAVGSTTYSFEEPKFRYSQPVWKLILQDCGSTPVTNTTKTTPGSGDYRQISAMEQLFHGNEGNYYRAQVPSPTFRSETSSSKTYAVIVIEFEDDMTTEIGGVAKSLKQLYIACEKGAGGAYTDANTGLGTTLNAYITAYSIPNNGVTVATEINA